MTPRFNFLWARDLYIRQPEFRTYYPLCYSQSTLVLDHIFEKIQTGNFVILILLSIASLYFIIYSIDLLCSVVNDGNK